MTSCKIAMIVLMTFSLVSCQTISGLQRGVGYELSPKLTKTQARQLREFERTGKLPKNWRRVVASNRSQCLKDIGCKKGK